MAGLVLLACALGTITAESKIGQTLAAWFQAVGSVAAIWASVRMVRWQIDQQREADAKKTRDQDDQRRRVVLQIAEEAASILQEMAANFSSEPSVRRYLKERYDPRHIEAVAHTLKEVPVWQLPEPELVMPIVVIRKAVARAGAAAARLYPKRAAVTMDRTMLSGSDEATVVMQEASAATAAIERLRELVASLR
jgi:hypothetical protein